MHHQDLPWDTVSRSAPTAPRQYRYRLLPCVRGTGRCRLGRPQQGSRCPLRKLHRGETKIAAESAPTGADFEESRARLACNPPTPKIKPILISGVEASGVSGELLDSSILHHQALTLRGLVAGKSFGFAPTVDSVLSTVQRLPDSWKSIFALHYNVIYSSRAKVTLRICYLVCSGNGEEGEALEPAVWVYTTAGVLKMNKCSLRCMVACPCFRRTSQRQFIDVSVAWCGW